jgi:hypothetical protein
MRNTRTRHLIRVDEEALLEWLADYYRKQKRSMAPALAPVGSRLDDAKVLGFDPEDSAVIGTTINEGGLSFIVLEIKHHLKAIK